MVLTIVLTGTLWRKSQLFSHSNTEIFHRCFLGRIHRIYTPCVVYISLPASPGGADDILYMNTHTHTHTHTQRERVPFVASDQRFS